MENYSNFIPKSWTILVVCLSIFIALLAGESNQSAFAENKTVIIPMGAANPNFDTPTLQWFAPSVITVKEGDTVTWVNNDTEIHTITSGKGITRAQFATSNSIGTPDGLFASEPFKPGESWSYTFTKAGIFHYYCSIHPWMNGAVVVSQNVPETPTDAAGNPITTWPIVGYTLYRQYEADIAWDPHVILTGEKITFPFNFYDPNTSKILVGTPYDFVIIQNGKELLRSSGVSGTAGDYRVFVFKDSGTVFFKLENIGNNPAASAEYSTIVYQNPNATNANIPIIQPARNIELGTELWIILITPPIAIFIFVILHSKGLLSKDKHKKPEKEFEDNRSPV